MQIELISWVHFRSQPRNDIHITIRADGKCIIQKLRVYPHLGVFAVSYEINRIKWAKQPYAKLLVDLHPLAD